MQLNNRGKNALEILHWEKLLCKILAGQTVHILESELCSARDGWSLCILKTAQLSRRGLPKEQEEQEEQGGACSCPRRAQPMNIDAAA